MPNSGTLSANYLLFLGFTGCANSINYYAPPDPAANPTATVVGSNLQDGVFLIRRSTIVVVKKVDGAFVDTEAWSSDDDPVVLAPGKHNLTYEVIYGRSAGLTSGPALAVTDSVVDLDFKAGEYYTIEMAKRLTKVSALCLMTTTWVQDKKGHTVSPTIPVYLTNTGNGGPASMLLAESFGCPEQSVSETQ